MNLFSREIVDTLMSVHNQVIEMQRRKSEDFAKKNGLPRAQREAISQFQKMVLEFSAPALGHVGADKTRTWRRIADAKSKKDQMNNLIVDLIYSDGLESLKPYRDNAEEILGFRPRSKKYGDLLNELIGYYDQKAWKRQTDSAEPDQDSIAHPTADEICRQLEALSTAIEVIKAERNALAAERAAFNADREHLREMAARAIESVAQLPESMIPGPAVAEAEVVEIDDLEPEPSGQPTRPARPKASGK